MAIKESLWEKGLKFKPTALPLATALFATGITTTGCDTFKGISIPSMPQIPKYNLPQDKEGHTLLTPEALGFYGTAAIIGLAVIVVAKMLIGVWNHALRGHRGEGDIED